MQRTLTAAAVLVTGLSTASAQVPAGPEFRVNTHMTSTQKSPALAVGPDGGFVVTWTSYHQDGMGFGVFGQRYDARGAPRGGEFGVHAFTTTNQLSSGVAALRDGGFVVVWDSPAPNYPAWSVFGQAYDASGARRGEEFAVNTVTTLSAGAPAVAPTPDGFVVVWSAQESNGWGIFGQRFDTSGRRIGNEFQADSSDGDHLWPHVGVDGTGGFVVVWPGWRWRDSGFGIFGQRFDRSAGRLGDEFQVNAYTSLGYTDASVAAKHDGGFVVAWQEAPWDLTSSRVLARRYAPGGAPLGYEFLVNAPTTRLQYGAAVAADRNGDFVIVWTDTWGDGSERGVVARRFNADGSSRGAQFRVNSYTTHWQYAPVVGVDETGNVVAAWSSLVQDERTEGVYAQRFGGLQPAALAVDTAGNGVCEPGETFDVRPSWRNVNGTAQEFGGALSGLTGPPGADYEIVDAGGSYGSVPDGTTRVCTDCYGVSVSHPPERPGRHWDVSVLESITPGTQGQTKRWSLHIGGSFEDVADASPFYRFVETLLHQGVTGGCTAAAFCPKAPTTRGATAVLVLLAKEGRGFEPLPCRTPVFRDVPADSPFCPFIEELGRRGIATGCGGGDYCPAAAITREQLAVLLLRTLDPALSPPACTVPMFADVPTSSPFCRWVEELARRGITSGCGGGRYCPVDPVTREQMAVFVSATFGLTLYGT